MFFQRRLVRVGIGLLLASLMSGALLSVPSGSLFNGSAYGLSSGMVVSAAGAFMLRRALGFGRFLFLVLGFLLVLSILVCGVVLVAANSPSRTCVAPVVGLNVEGALHGLADVGSHVLQFLGAPARLRIHCVV